MARKQRQKSATGIYHVMLRGINKQNIFFCDDDFVKMMYVLHDSQYRKNMQGKVVADNVCTIYAYCILDNHLHILIREGEDDISTLIKRIEDRYVAYYNLKYDRIGHLFQGRFLSEPVNDAEYFHRLLRYIHRNSVKAMEAHTPEEYPFSSWNEYAGHKSNIVKVLKASAIKAVFDRYKTKDLIEWVNMDVDDKCLDMDSCRNIISDSEAHEILTEVSGFKNIEDFRFLDHPTQINYLLKAVEAGISLRQASRLGTVTFYQLQKASGKVGNEDARSNGQFQPSDIHNAISTMEGLGKQTRQKLHLIIEYLENHPNSKRVDIATSIDTNVESTRKLLVRLVNEGLINQVGKANNTRYNIKSV